MAVDPINVVCMHLATDAEKERDPEYAWCNAQPGQPCIWAKRDSAPPRFHSERIESAAAPQGLTDEILDAASAALNAGLV